MEKIEPYMAAIIQPDVCAAYNKSDTMKNLERYCDLIDSIVMWNVGYGASGTSSQTRLIAFPENFIQVTGMGCDLRMTIKDLEKSALTIPGEETDRLAERARANDTYVCGHSYENDPNFPKHVFGTVFIINPMGNIIYKYRKVQINNMIEVAISPHAVFDEYMEVYGKGKSVSETLFPVIKTDIGYLGAFVCYDGEFPEPARILALQGAEVLLRPTAYMQPLVTGSENTLGGSEKWRLTNRCRAFENMCYVIAPNIGEFRGSPWPRMWDPGHSMIVDYEGRVLVEAAPGENMISAPIFIENIRMKRRTLGENRLSHVVAEAYAEAYQKEIFPKNFALKKPPESLVDIWEQGKISLERFWSERYGEKIEALPPGGGKLPEPLPILHPTGYKPEVPWEDIKKRYKEIFGWKKD